MNFMETLLISALPALVTGVVSFLISRSQLKAKVQEINSNYDVKISSINATLKQQESDHKHELEMLSKSFELQEKKTSGDMTNQLASKFFDGELDISKLAESIAPLMELSEQIDKIKKK